MPISYLFVVEHGDYFCTEVDGKKQMKCTMPLVKVILSVGTGVVASKTGQFLLKPSIIEGLS